MAINSNALAEMEVPESFLEALPKVWSLRLSVFLHIHKIMNYHHTKMRYGVWTVFLCFVHLQNGRACLGDIIYRYITSDQFSSECLLDCLDLSSEHVALEIANRVEASIYVWRRRTHHKPMTNPNRSTAKSSWEMVKDLMVDGDKRELLAERAESLFLSLKQRFPGLTQTTLDTSKIQCNKVRIDDAFPPRIVFCLFLEMHFLFLYLSLWQIVFVFSGCGEIHSRKLLESFGKPGI